MMMIILLFLLVQLDNFSEATLGVTSCVRPTLKTTEVYVKDGDFYASDRSIKTRQSNDTELTVLCDM